MRRIGTPGVALLALLGALSFAHACNVPVFRYALERWPADSYQLLVFHDRDLLPAEQAIVDAIQEESYYSPQSGNLVANWYDLRTLDDPVLAKLAEAEHPHSYPWAVIILPPKAGRITPIWSGPIADLKVDQVRHSPARTELTRRLLAGDSVVWVVLAGEEKQANDELQQQLAAEFQRLEEEILLPPGIGAPGSEVLLETPLGIHFSQLWVDRTDPREEAFLNMLLSSRPEWKERKDPLVIPVFGRGRALEAFTAEEVTADLLTDVNRFLCGACSCQVKEQNPGFDLLLAAAWDPNWLRESNNARPTEGSEQRLSSGATQKESTGPQLVSIPPGQLEFPPAEVDVTESNASTSVASEKSHSAMGAFFGVAGFALLACLVVMFQQPNWKH